MAQAELVEEWLLIPLESHLFKQFQEDQEEQLAAAMAVMEYLGLKSRHICQSVQAVLVAEESVLVLLVVLLFQVEMVVMDCWGLVVAVVAQLLQVALEVLVVKVAMGLL
jgi:hypothetical protein